MKRSPHTPIFDPNPSRGTINPGDQISGGTGPCVPTLDLLTTQLIDRDLAEVRWGTYGNGYFYINWGPRLTIMDTATGEIVSRTNINLLDFAGVGDRGMLVSPSGQYLYMGGTNPVTRFITVDVSDPTNPTVVHTIYDPIRLPRTQQMVRDGNILYAGWVISSPNYYITTIDISVESAPVITAYTLVGTTAGQAFPVIAQDGLMVTQPQSGSIHGVWDISSPTAPVFVGSLSVGNFIEDAVFVGDLLWCTGGGFLSGGVTVNDLSNPADPFPIGVGALPPLTTSMQRYSQDGNLGVAVQSTTSTLAVCDVTSRPYRMRSVGSLVDGTNLVNCSAVIVEGSWAYVACSARVTTVNLSTPSTPTIGTSITANQSASTNYDFCKSGDFLFVPSRNNDRLNIYNVSSPGSMTQVASITDARLNEATGTAVIGDYCFVSTADATGLLGVVNVSTPASPVVVGSLADGRLGVSLSCFGVYGNHLYIGKSAGIVVVDVSTPTAPVYVTTFTHELLGGFVRTWARDGNILWVVQYTERTMIALDVSDPANPTFLGSIATRGEAYGVKIEGDLLYTATAAFGLNAAVRPLNISDPTNVKWFANPADTGPPFSTSIEWAQNLVYGGADDLYVSSEANDFFFYKVDISDPNYPTIAGVVEQSAAVQGDQSTFYDNGEIINMSDMGLSVMDTNLNTLRRFQHAATWAIDGWILDGNYLYIVAQMTVSKIDVTDPHNPAILGEMSVWGTTLPNNPTSPPTSRPLTGDMALRDDGILAVFSEATFGAIYLLDVNGDTPEIISITMMDEDEDFTDGSLVIEGDYLYSRMERYFFVFDISDLTNPTIVGRIDNDFDNLNFVLAPNLIWKVGDYVLTLNSDTISKLVVINVSDPANPFVSNTLYDPVWQDTEAGILHDNILYLAHDNGIKAVNVSDPTHPVIISTLTNGVLGFTSGMTVGNNRLFVNGGSPGGIRGINITNPLSMSIVLTRTTALPATAAGYGNHIKYIDGTLYFGDTYGPSSDLPFSQRGAVWMIDVRCD